MTAAAQKSDFFKDFFDATIDLPNSRQIIDDAPTTEDIFIDDDLFSENNIEDDDKQIIDDISKDTNYGDILMQYTQLEKDIKIGQKAPETLNFKELLLPKRKWEKSSLLSTSKAISKKYKRIRQKKNDDLKSIKQVLLHPRDRLARKAKNTTSGNDITFIKQVPLHPRDRLKRLTRDINGDMSTIIYFDDDVNIDDLSDAETVNYINNATVKTPKKITTQLQANKIKRECKNLKRKINKKNKLATSKKIRQKDDDVIFVKQVLLRPRDRVKKLTKDDDVVFVKQVPLHQRDRLKKKTGKLKPIYPRNKMKRQALQIAAENAETLLKSKFIFYFRKILSKTILSDTSRTNEEKVMDKILEALSADNDELYVLHGPGTNAFTLK